MRWMRILLAAVLLMALAAPAALAAAGSPKTGGERPATQAGEKAGASRRSDEGPAKGRPAAGGASAAGEGEESAAEQSGTGAGEEGAVEEQTAAGNAGKQSRLWEKAVRKAEALQARAEELLQRAEATRADRQPTGQQTPTQAELEAAAAALEEAGTLNPASREVFRRLGHLYQELGREAVKVWVKGKPVKVMPILRDGRSLIPLRALAEALGAEVTWDGETRTVTFTRAGNTVLLQIGSTTVLVNGQGVTIDVPAAIAEGRTLVPLRAVAELLRAQVDYDPETGNVIVVDPDSPPPADDAAGADGTQGAGQS